MRDSASDTIDSFHKLVNPPMTEEVTEIGDYRIHNKTANGVKKGVHYKWQRDRVHAISQDVD